MILVGRGTYLADQPRLDVRLPGLEDMSPRRALLTRGEAVDGWETLRNPRDVYRLHDVNDLLVEGGSATATAFLSRRSGRPHPDLPRADHRRRGQVEVRLCRARRDRRRPRPVATCATSSASASTGSKFTSGFARARRAAMFTGIVTDVGTVRSAEQRGDLRLVIDTGYDTRHRRPRRLDRLLGRVPDRGRQGRLLVRGRRLGRNRVAHRGRPLARRREAQP